MMTLKEIESIILPKENIDMKNVLKDLLSQTVKNGELITFKKVYLYDVGDPHLYAHSVALVNGNIIIATRMEYGGDIVGTCIGTLGDAFNYKKGIKLTDDALIQICKTILEKKYETIFDFLSMKGVLNFNFNGEYLEGRLEENEFLRNEINDYINGKKVGYINL